MPAKAGMTMKMESAMKRILDFTLALFGLLALSPLIVIFLFLIWRQDHHSPIYPARRVGKNGKIITVYKMRSMVVNADQQGGPSTSATDVRITKLGHFVRQYKIDELLQLWNVLMGTMSFVGPRPTIEEEVKLYNQEEKRLLTVLPGITDFSSIVFSDEGDILKEYPDPDLAFDQVIKPWKIQLGLFYIKHQTLWMDMELIVLTALSFISKKTALKRIGHILKKYQANDELIQVAARDAILLPRNVT